MTNEEKQALITKILADNEVINASVQAKRVAGYGIRQQPRKKFNVRYRVGKPPAIS
jgi:hypothetical protein